MFDPVSRLETFSCRESLFKVTLLGREGLEITHVPGSRGCSHFSATGEWSACSVQLEKCTWNWSISVKIKRVYRGL